ncbi:M15 family metallopeptidase [Weissella paramesenteroides]|uniref:M15 family metallopeptidase n=1 Tax=Weissella paramesenteroides TaxID=1249 RepID=UPI001C1F93F7|nr:M15 family metallopeptidase [Weissella paramesenteroides]MBU7557404.1 M15 family metallopeptidase [Weissella paramesenteroides]
MLDFTDTPIETPVTNWDWSPIREVPIRENDEPLISLSYLPEKMVVSPQYFIQNLPGSYPELYTRLEVQNKLISAARKLPYGYKFVIFDTWRSIPTQQALFDQMKHFVQRDHPGYSDEQVQQAALRIVALPSTDPMKPSPHNTGGSIDLSIVDEDGRLLEMGSPFDDISVRAKTTYYETEETSEAYDVARRNRRLLYHIMMQAGFTNYSEEWWHFDYGNQNWASLTNNGYAIYGATKPVFPWVEAY